MKKKKYSNIYFALFVCLAAVAVGSIVSVKTAITKKKPEETGFTRVTYKWTVPATEERVNAEQTGVEDNRLHSAEQSTEALERNKPYSGDFALPMGSDIIKDYSNGEMVRSKTMGDWRIHNGVDFGGSAGNDVVAAGDGTVTAVYDDSFWGTVVEIDHGNGMTARYCGLKSGSCLPEGSEVKKYDKIGSLGHIPVEISDEDHLHLEVLIDGETVDPLKALNKVGAADTD